MWPLSMASNGGLSVDVRIHSWPGPTVDVGPSIARPTVDARPTTVGPGHPQSAWVASWPRTQRQTTFPPLEAESRPYYIRVIPSLISFSPYRQRKERKKHSRPARGLLLHLSTPGLSPRLHLDLHLALLPRHRALSRSRAQEGLTPCAPCVVGRVTSTP